VREEQDVLGNVREAVRILESSSRFASRMPGVGSNVAMALAGASGREGVAAIPGGLFEMKGAVKAPAPPEFGVSKHVATVLLGAHARRPSIRGCVNVAASAEFERAARAARCGIVPLPAEEERDAQAVASRVGRVPPKRRVDVLWQAGAFGVEPTAYVVGSSAVDAVRKALTLLGEESAAAARGREKTGGASPKARNPRGAPGAGAVTRPRGAPRRRAGKSSR
jgi:predicted fused transcriptional regulator/phosphomethylpyrimidine kinase